MSRPHAASLFSHLALALAGLALGVAELDFLPEAPGIVVVYLVFVFLAWQSAGQWGLPVWAVNTLGLLIAGLASGWTAARLGDTETLLWQRDVPLPVAIVPFLGPMLMGLTVVRLFCPRSPGDFWVLQGLGVLQVALGCVLTNGTLFGGALLAYLVVALCALAANEQQEQASRSAPAAGPAATEHLGGWLWFSLRWTVGVGLLALPLFLLTPRATGPDWEPWTRFGYQEPPQARTGFSEEIDLNRSGALEGDDTVAFRVTVTDRDGQPTRGLPATQRWRGVVLDRYDNGRWRNGLSWTPLRSGVKRADDDPDTALVHFRVPRRTGGLFLAEPVRLGAEVNSLPVWPPDDQRRGPSLFHEFAGTVIPVIPATYLTRAEYRYTQALPRGSPDRVPALRTRGEYYSSLVENCPAPLRDWTPELLARLAAGGRFEPLRQAIRARATTGDALPHAQWEAAARLLSDYLARSGDYGYSLSFERESPQLDPAVDFLINVRQGPCERFATGLTLMLRSLGIPARVIKGFRGLDDAGDGAYEVRNSHAHAWVEALVLSADPDQLSFDWLTLDPTPGLELQQRQRSALARLWQLQQSGQALWQDLIVGYGPTRQADLWNDLAQAGRWRAFAPWLGTAALAALAAWLWRRRRRRRSKLGQAGASALYDRLVGLLAGRMGLAQRSDETPRELAGRAAEAIGRRVGLAGFSSVPGQVVELYYESRFGGRPPGPPALAEAQSRVAALEAALR